METSRSEEMVQSMHSLSSLSVCVCVCVRSGHTITCVRPTVDTNTHTHTHTIVDIVAGGETLFKYRRKVSMSQGMR